MKQFLKSTAVFACVALMFCACSDDGTEDSLTAADLGLTTIRNVSPGEERAWVKWTVPANDNIAKCVLSWTSDDAGVSESMTYTAVEGVMETSKENDLQNLPAGKYTFSIKSVSSSGTESVTSSESVYIYDQDTYTQRPNPSTITIDDNGVSIMWSDIPADCDGVIINYDNGGITYVDTEYLKVSATEPTVIADAVPSSLFTFRTFYLPNSGLENEGLDLIEVAEDQENDYMFPATSPSSPTSIYTRPGKNRFKVYWNVAYVADIVASYVEVSDGSKVIVSGSNLKKGSGESNVNELEFVGLEPGDYTISIYNRKSTDNYSDVVTADVTVYEQETYDYSVKIAQDLTINSSKELEIGWDYSAIATSVLDDCLGVIATATNDGTIKNTSMGYYTVDQTEYKYEVGEEEDYLAAQSELPSWSTIDEAESGWIISYKTYFCPADGLDIIEVSGSETESAKITIPSITSPSKLESVSFIPGDYSIFLEFDVPSDTSINKICISYENVDDPTNADIIEIAKSNIKYGRDNFTSITTDDGLKIDAKYDIKIWSEASDGTPSAFELGESILVYDYSIFQSDCASPVLTPSFSDTYPYAVEFSWSEEEIDYIKFTYVYNTNGDSTEITIDDITTPTILSGVMPGTAYSYVTVCTPAPNAMDSYSLPSVGGTFPYARVDKSLISIYPLDGDAAVDSSSDYNYVEAVFDGLFSLSTSAGTGAMATVEKYLTEVGQANMTLSYDLGAIYKLSEFYYTPFYGYVYTGFYDTTTTYNNTIQTFSLWGTAESEPKNDIYLNRTNSDGTPDLQDWICLLDNVTVPDLLNEDFSTETDTYDYNGDGVVGVDDVYYAILNLGGLKIEIPEENRQPVRYVRMQFHTAANLVSAQESIDAGGTTDYREIFNVVELDHTHMGCEVE